MRNLLSSIAVLSAMALPVVAHADMVDFTFTASGASSTGTITATNNGNGSETITSISGTYIAGMVQPGQFNNNDNLLYTDSGSLLDPQGVAFAGSIFGSGFLADIFSTGGGNYSMSFLDQGYTGTMPISLQVADAPLAPEPGGLILLGTGLLGIIWIVRRRAPIPKADIPRREC